MDDLLKEAIADAKAVRETALQNAKIALEEAFTPRLQSMLSQKIQNEVEDADETDAHDEEEDAEEGSMREEEDDDDKDVDVSVSDEEDAEEGRGMDEEDDDAEEGRDTEETYEGEHDAEEGEHEGGDDDDDDDDDDDLDLEAVIKELEAEEGEDVEEDDLEEIANDVSSGIGTADNKLAATAANDDNQVDPEGEGGEEPEDAVYDEGEDAPSEELDEVIDLEEVLAALKEEEDTDEEEEVDESAEQINQLSSDLKEHRKVIKFLKSKLNEVNLLNAKLLFTNKLFKNYSLNNSQKMKVVETFDRAGSLREVKLVYSTLAESFNYGNSVSKKGTQKVAVNEGKASKPVKSTKPSKKVINEGQDLANRFKKLAGLL